MLIGSKSMNSSVANSVFGKKKNKDLKWVTIGDKHLAVLEGGYKKYRELHGRQTDHVDFSFNNSMWNDINIISNSSDHSNGMVIIGAKEEKQKDKLAGNTARRGDILDLSKAEIEDIKAAYKLEVLKVLKSNGL